MEKKGHSIQREISWLDFNERVLLEAKREQNPLSERMRFLGIFSNNLDEFFKVRFASVRRELKLNSKKLNSKKSGSKQLLEAIHKRVLQLQLQFDETFEQLKKEFSKKYIYFKNETQLTKNQKEYLENYFEEEIRHFLIPLLLNPKGAFPALNDNELYLLVHLKLKDEREILSLIEVPSTTPRFIQIPTNNHQNHVIFLEDVIRLNLHKIFSTYDVKKSSAYALKVVRDAEYELEADYSKSVLDKISKSIKQRSKGDYVRINFDKTIPSDLLKFILAKTKISDSENIIPGGRYHNKRDLMRFPDFGNPELNFMKQPPWEHPMLIKSKNILDTIENHDLLLHFPYQKFSHVLDILRAAAIDPFVRTIRITLYRVAKDSHILHALVNAAKNGKRVIVIVEVQARFDEEHNVEITRMLQESGVIVIPGVNGLKVHCKLFQISRKQNGKTTRITHIGTGNFHEKTARVYSDTTLLTSHLEIGREVRRLFEFFESNYVRPVFRHLMVSPFNTRRKLNELIQSEIAFAKKKKDARIILKLNNLSDESIIKRLQDASEHGVKVSGIIRGVCMYHPTNKVSELNSEFKSIIGRYLEHSRIYYFHNNGKPLIWLGSADLMSRNLDYRIEVVAPIYDEQLQKEIINWLNLQMQIDVKALSLKPGRINTSTCLNEPCIDTQAAWKNLLQPKTKKA